MPRRHRSSIDKLPRELRDELERLLQTPSLTILQITDHMKLLGADLSKSAVHRYSQHFERITEDIRLTREMARAVGRELEDLDGGDSTQLLVESLQALLLRARMQLSESEEVEPAAVGFLAKAVKDLQTAQKSSVDMQLKLRQQVAKEAAKAAEETAVAQGLSSETVELIKARILGIAQ